MESQRMQTGRELLERLSPGAEAALHAALDDIAPDMVEMVVAFGYGDVHSRPGLATADRQVATIAALAALGNAEPQLAFHIDAGLTAGLSPREVVETLYVTTVFAGFPAGLNALAVARRVFDARGVRPEPAAPSEGDRRTRGLKALSATSSASGQAVLDALGDIAPEMGAFILDFSYGDVISRPGLSARRKEIAMVAAAAARGAMRPQLKVHAHAGLLVGLTRTELTELAMQIAGYAGFPASLNALAALREVYAEADAAR
ncbi:MAG: carboxymuconolactone decarboxylase [Desulfovibrionaceae bacterium CG1_02_65_16]|nr:MAG: carboxymuconolactone decarboxylase [Desulfovibrionaceae bacterium CG1_02_65_16]